MKKARLQQLATVFLMVLLSTIGCFAFYRYESRSSSTNGMLRLLVLSANPVAILSFALIAANIGSLAKLSKSWVTFLYVCLVLSLAVLAVF